MATGTSEKTNTIIIGAGNIGLQELKWSIFLKQTGTVDLGQIYFTKQTPGGVEQTFGKLDELVQKNQLPLYKGQGIAGVTEWKETLKSLSSQGPFQVVIATPYESHAGILATVLDYKPRAVLVEKPIGCLEDIGGSDNTGLLESVVEGYESAGIPLWTNYVLEIARESLGLFLTYPEGVPKPDQKISWITASTAQYDAKHIVLDLSAYFIPFLDGAKFEEARSDEANKKVHLAFVGSPYRKIRVELGYGEKNRSIEFLDNTTPLFRFEYGGRNSQINGRTEWETTWQYTHFIEDVRESVNLGYDVIKEMLRRFYTAPDNPVYTGRQALQDLKAVAAIAERIR